jgi:hypothetical protein
MLLHRWTRHAELLLQYQVLHVDDRACVGQRPPVLHWVARYIAQEDATAFLLDHGAHVDAPDESGHTALHVAVEMRHIAVVRRLLESSARVDAASAYGFRPIDYTYQYGDGRTQCVLRTQRTDADREIESVLLGAGARPATPCAPGAACVCSGNRY